jgi:hypothetical protein
MTLTMASPAFSTVKSSAGALISPLSRASASTNNSSLFEIKKNLGTLKSSSVEDSGTASKANPLFYKAKLEKRSRIRVSLDNQRTFNPFTDLLKQPSLVASVLDDRGRNLQTFDKVAPGKTQQFTTTDKLDSGNYFLKVTVAGSKRSVDYKLQVRRASSGLFGTGLFS